MRRGPPSRHIGAGRATMNNMMSSPRRRCTYESRAMIAIIIIIINLLHHNVEFLFGHPPGPKHPGGFPTNHAGFIGFSNWGPSFTPAPCRPHVRRPPHPDNYETARQIIGIGGLGGPTISGPKGKCPGGPGPARENQPGPWWGQIIPGWGMPGEALGPVGSGAPIPTRRRQECRRNTFYTPYRGSGFWDRARAHSKELRATQGGRHELW